MNYSVDYIYGIDFSGAKNAGKKIWVAKGIVSGRALHIESCLRAADLHGSSRTRDACLEALRRFIAIERPCVFGLDFPFGLPRKLVRDRSWEKFALSFPRRYSGPTEFKNECHEEAGGKELKRLTDRESRTPFSPYNLWLFRQTFYGIRDILHPLVRDRSACVLPMQKLTMGKPWIIEICPASTLKNLGLEVSYKGKEEKHRRGRKSILKAIDKEGVLVKGRRLIQTIIEDKEGDALDSIIAAFATLRSLKNLAPIENKDAYSIEGFVYI